MTLLTQLYYQAVPGRHKLRRVEHRMVCDDGWNTAGFVIPRPRGKEPVEYLARIGYSKQKLSALRVFSHGSLAPCQASLSALCILSVAFG